MKLTAQNVHDLFLECLFREEEPQESPAIAEGIMATYVFHPGRLAEHKQDIADMLADLPDEFQSGKGGGMSFLNACMTRDGEHWGEHPTMEKLFCLGMAAGLVKSALPRSMWNSLPGGMPYYVVLAPQPQPESAV